MTSAYMTGSSLGIRADAARGRPGAGYRAPAHAQAYAAGCSIDLAAHESWT